MQYLNMLPAELLNDANAIIDRIRGAGKILVAAHLRPDGDATGSVSGLIKSLQKAGKSVEAALFDGVPREFAFVWPKVRLLREPQINSDHDLIMVLDSGDADRTGFTFNRDPKKPV